MYTEEAAEAAALLQIGAARPEGFDKWHTHQRVTSSASRAIRHRHGRAAARRYHRHAAAQTRRHLPQVHEGDDSQHRRTEPRAALGQRSRSPRALCRTESQPNSRCPFAETIVDVASCPGTDTCKLGISSSRGLAGELRKRLAAKNAEMDEVIGGLRIKVSGCFNSCGQHHVADLGFYGVSRKKGNYVVPHFQVLLGGEWQNNAGTYGLAIGAVPSKRIPETVDRITTRFRTERLSSETFQAFIKRIGKAECKKMIDDFTAIPSHDEDPSFYSDWGDPREFSIGDIGVGECAGEVVFPIDFELVACEREVFEAQLQLEAGNIEKASRMAYEAMLHGAQALLKFRFLVCPGRARRRSSKISAPAFFDTEIFFDPFVKGKFAQDFFNAHENAGSAKRTAETAHQLIEEAQLFIEACYSCHARMTATPAKVTA